VIFFIHQNKTTQPTQKRQADKRKLRIKKMKNTALITGSYGGLGTCFVNIHADKGGDLILVGRSQKKLDAQAAEVIEKYHVTAHTIAVDLSLPEAAQHIYDICREKGWLPDMIDRGSGRVLNVSSTAAIMPGPLQAVYYATKAYVTSWSNALWRELQGTGVTVTALMPGAMNTGFARAGGLTETKMFSNTVEPLKVAEDGYNGMMKGVLNVISGLPGWQKPFMSMAPMLPKKTMLNFVYNQQNPNSANWIF
jgi:short-subunit dehydrogenase